MSHEDVGLLTVPMLGTASRGRLSKAPMMDFGIEVVSSPRDVFKSGHLVTFTSPPSLVEAPT